MSYTNADDFIEAVKADFSKLSKQLKTIARHVELNRERLALDGIQEVANQCGVQPSAVIRFAKHFGFSGYSEMQTLFRARAEQQLAPNGDYHHRLRDAIRTQVDPLSATGIAREIISSSITSLEALRDKVIDSRFEEAVNILVKAKSLWISASRRSFPVGAYLTYSFQHTERPIHWLNGVGHMQLGQARAFKKGDVLLAVSFEPYANETLQIIKIAKDRGARVIVISDSLISLLAEHADIILPVQDGTTFGFRSLTSTLALAQSLFLAVAYRLELAYPAMEDKL